MTSLYAGLQDLSGARYAEANHAGDTIDLDLLRTAREQGEALPTAGDTDRDIYHGAVVFDPVAGVHRNVCYPDYSCFTPDHTVMTPDGPKHITEFEVGDEVYTLDEETHELVVDTVVDTHEYDHDGQIHHIQSDSQDLRITPNHNLYLASQYSGPRDELSPDDFEKVPVAESASSYQYAAEHDGLSEETRVPSHLNIVDDLDDIYAVLYVRDGRTARHQLPDSVHERAATVSGMETVMGESRKWTKYYVPIELFREHETTVRDAVTYVRYKTTREAELNKWLFEFDPLIDLVGWYVSEGSCRGATIKIANEDDEFRDEIGSVFERLNVEYTVTDRSVRAGNSLLARWLEVSFGDDSHNKQLRNTPFLQMGERRSRRLLSVLVDGDGTGEIGESAHYYTSSETLAEDVAHLAVRAGYKPRIKERDRDETEFVVYIKTGGSFNRSKNETVEMYNGTVHCITAEENHVILAGRNGMYQWVGQSLYPNIMRDGNMSPETILGVGESTLVRSEYSKDELRWSYIDPRPVKQLDDAETYSNFTDGQYKMVYDPSQSEIKWRDDWSRIQEYLEPIYFLPPSECEGLLASRADTYIRWNKSYEGTLYKATKRVRNALYGVSGDSNFRLFDWRVAEAITIGGRMMLNYGADKIVERLQSTFNKDAVYVTHGDSVPADEPVIVRREGGSIDVLPAEYVHEQVQSGERMKIWSDQGWTEIKRSIQKPNRKQTYAVRTKSGIVRVTEDHSLLLADGTEVTPEQVEEGDRLLHSDVGATEPQCDSQQRRWSDDEAWLLGLFVADGTAGHYEYDYRSDKYSWAITNESHERLERAQNVLSYEWDFKTTINDTRESSGCYKLQSTGQQYDGEKDGRRQDIVREFVVRCYVNGEKRVPPSILNGTDAERRAFLDGYLQGDGGDHGTSALDGFNEMSTKSNVLAAQLTMLIRWEGDQVTLDFDPSHGNLNRCIRRVSFHRGDPTEVTSVRPIDYDGDHVYDFETENHHFHAGVGSTIVHNTDGFGVCVDQDVGRGHVLPRVKETVEWLNDTGMPEFVEETFGVPAEETAHEVDLESYSPKLLIPVEKGGGSRSAATGSSNGRGSDAPRGTKKTYAERVTWDEGDECDELSITGFEAKRSDVADITADVQADVLEAILYEPRLSAKETVYERIREAVAAIQSGDEPLERLGQRKGLSKAPSEYGSEGRSAQPEYRGAKYAKKHIDGEDEFAKPMKFPVERITGDLPKTYNTETGEDGDKVDWISVEDPSNIPEEIVIDRDTIVTKTLKQPLRSILHTMGWRWDEAIHGHEQTGLSSFGEPTATDT